MTTLRSSRYASTRARRTLRLVGVALIVVLDGALVVVAGCDTTSPPEAGSEVVPEASTDARADGGPTERDASLDGGGNCSAVQGTCDIVLQDCPADSRGRRQECVVAAGSPPSTECVAEQASQQLPMGRACCPPRTTQQGNPCLPGLTCVGRPCEDGGPPTGRCSPACCEGDDRACGKSDPEGIAGACNLVLVNAEGDRMHHVCSWRERCSPFGVEPCRAGQVCLVEDAIGTSSCVSSMGAQNREPCAYANDCADGYICIGGADAGRCRMLCLTPGAVHPFDAAVEEGGAGAGGCIAGEQCLTPLSSAPTWLSVCTYPDGG